MSCHRSLLIQYGYVFITLRNSFMCKFRILMNLKILFINMRAAGCQVRFPGGHSHWKGVWGCAAVMTPFFQASRRSLAHQFTLNAPLLCPLFSIFRKFLHFLPCFGQNSSSLDPNFSKFSFSRPQFFSGKSAP